MAAVVSSLASGSAAPAHMYTFTIGHFSPWKCFVLYTTPLSACNVELGDDIQLVNL